MIKFFRSSIALSYYEGKFSDTQFSNVLPSIFITHFSHVLNSIFFETKVILYGMLAGQCTLDSGINIGVRLLIFEKKIEGKKMKNDRNALFDVKMN